MAGNDAPNQPETQSPSAAAAQLVTSAARKTRQWEARAGRRLAD